MSYSRWSNSTWYTFWSAFGDDLQKEDQVLSLWLDIEQAKDWPYSQIKDWTIQDVCEAYENITYEQAEEAWGYIQVWLEDVDEEFNSKR